MLSSQFTVKHELLFCLLITTAIASIYGQVINYEFINFDDQFYVVENSYVQHGLTNEGFKWAFSFQNKEGSYWHPLTWLSHMADVTLFANQSGLHHLTNTIWHVLNTCLFFLLLHRTTRMFWSSVLAASFFAVHPVNVETVAWIAERKNLLSTFFWLLSIAAYVFYTRSPSFIKYVLLFIIYVAGLMAKPMLVTLPFVFLLLDYWPLKRISLNCINTKKKQSSLMRIFNQIVPRLLEKVPLICIAFLVSYLTTESLSEHNNVIAFSAIPLYLRVENLFVSYSLYLGKLIWPFNLAVFYPFPKSLPVAQVTVSALLLGSITLAILGPFREKKSFTVGWLWFIGTLIPVSGLIQAGLWPAMADRWAYVPFMGLFIIFSWSIHEFLNRQRHKHIWSIAITILVILVFGSISWRQVRNWQNSETLFSHALAVTSLNNIAHNNLGVAIVEKGRIEEAISHFHQALAINSRFVQGYNNLGNALVKQGKAEEAIQVYLKALRIKTNFFEAHNNLANAYVKMGSPKKAIIHFRKALEIDADKVSFYNFANTLMKTGQTQEAIQNYRQALKQDPDDEKVHYNLGVALFDLERYNEAILSFKEALHIKPDYFEAHNNLANVFVQQQQTDQAINHYLKAIEFDPQSEVSLLNLANIFVKQKRYKEAVSYFAEYLLMHPEDSGVHFNMAKALAELGRIEEAVEHYFQVVTINPVHYESLNQLALLLVRLGKNDSAIAHLNRALILAPENAEIHYNLAYSLAAAGRSEEAKRHYASALDIYPAFVNAHNNLGILLAQENQSEQAISHFAKALYFDPSSIDGHTNMGIILFNLGKKDEALYHFQEAVKLSPENTHLQLLLHKASLK